MKLMRSYSKLLFLFIMLFLLAGCNFIDSLNTKYFNSEPVTKHKLTIQTVEFSSENIVKNVGVTLIDTKSKKVIGKEMVDNEGIAIFSGLKPNASYKIVIHQILDSGEWLEQNSKEIVYDQNNSKIKVKTFNSTNSGSLHVPVVLQNPELPNGCEITSLTAVLKFYGLKVNKVQLAKKYLKTKPVVKKGNVLYGPDPNDAFAGNPANKSKAYYAFPYPIVEAANKVLIDRKSNLRAIDMPNLTKREIIDFIESGVPVMAWVTTDFKKPRTKGYWIIKNTNKQHPIYMNMHVVVILGYKNGKVQVMNPLKGYQEIDEKSFFKSFNALGGQTVVVL